jgi:hypothetical protein
LGKWFWRYAVEIEAYSQQVVDKQYDSMVGGWCSNVVIEPYGMSLWKHIRRGWDAFSNFVSIEVGDGAQTRFWRDV